MRILTDEGVSKSTVKILQELGQTVVRVQELQLEGAGDRMILERSRAENFVLVTHDLDYNEMLAASGARLPSVVTIRFRFANPDVLRQQLQRVMTIHAPALESGAIIVVSETRIRVRPLPIEHTDFDE
jgi:predicted nuclease of predicted toxin-antitoxin system